ncbi:MAG: hypothetical protein JEZ09_16315, partial [Salinivirgaceae bacterium]|nr:hypothetical protein [Salinivirgaceae bacterium]
MKLKTLNETHWFYRCGKIKGFAALLTLIFAFSTNLVFSQTTLQTVDFETASNYTASPAESNANTSDPDYWIRTNGTTPAIYATNGFTTSNGSYFFAAEDLDNVAAGAYTVTCDAISVNGYSDLTIKLLVGSRSGASIEGEEYIKVQYNMDAAGWVTRAQFIGNQLSPFVDYYEDANADGTVDGPALTGTLSEFTYTIPATGSSLQVRIEVYNGGGEEIAFDYIRVLGTASATAPTVTTNAASSISTTTATLNGTVNANSASTSVTFEYGLTTSYGSSVTADQSPVTGTSDTPVSAAISSLNSNTTYHYRVVGVNSEGLVNGDDEFFTSSTPTVAFNSTSSSGLELVSSADLQIDLSALSGLDVSVDYTVTGTATGGGIDYALDNGTLTISALDANDNITIAGIVDDLLDENNETVIVTLSNPTNATLGTNTVHTYTITDNDATPTVTFTAASQSSANETGTMTITAQLSTASGQDVTIPFSINGSSTATGGGTDYSITASPLNISAGNTSADITITIATDAIDENNETVIVDMGTPTNATQGATTSHTATITDDDDAPTVTFTAASQSSANETGTMIITAQLSTASGQDVTIPFSINGSSTATGGGTD